MALFTKKEFCASYKIKSGDLSNYIKRKKIILTGELIDEGDPVNVIFIQKRAKNIDITPVISSPKPEKPSINIEVEEKKDTKSRGVSKKERVELNYAELEKQKKLADLMKVEVDTVHRQLQIDKLQGNSIPTDLVKGLISTLSKQFIASFKDGADGFLIEISKRKSLSNTELAELRGVLISIINSSSAKSITESKRQMKTIVNEYSEKKEVGEHE